MSFWQKIDFAMDKIIVPIAASGLIWYCLIKILA